MISDVQKLKAKAMKDFSTVSYRSDAAKPDLQAWKKAFEAEVAKPLDETTWDTLEQIPVKPLYTAADYEGMEHLDYTAGIAPFLRGPYASMYVTRPWTVRQYAG